MIENKQTSPALVLAAWIVVIIPAGWGVYNTVLSAAKLFTNPAPAAVAAPAGTSPATHP